MTRARTVRPPAAPDARQPPSPARQPPPRRRRRFLPRQHGAWAMLALPFAVGAAAAPDPAHLPLLIAWFAGYALSYFGFEALKSRRPRRVRTQLILYSALAAPAAALTLALRPGLLAFAPPFAALLAVNAWFAARRDERSIVNDFAAVAQACLMAPMAGAAGGAAGPGPWVAAVVLFAYFGGTALYVKTMIRDRGRPGRRVASIAWHAAASVLLGVVAASAGGGAGDEGIAGTLTPATWWLLTGLFAWLTARAAVLPRHALRPRTVGLIEIGHSTALLLVLTLG